MKSINGQPSKKVGHFYHEQIPLFLNPNKNHKYVSEKMPLHVEKVYAQSASMAETLKNEGGYPLVGTDDIAQANKCTKILVGSHGQDEQKHSLQGPSSPNEEEGHSEESFVFLMQECADV